MKLDQIKLLSELYETTPIEVQEKIIASGFDFSSIYQEIEMNSQYVDTHMDISLGDIPVNLHSHSFYEIIYVLSNSGTQYLAGTKRYLLQRGDIVIVPPGVSHEFIEASSHILPSYIPRFKNELFLLRTTGTSYEYIGNYFHQGLKEAHDKKECWQIALCGNTLQLLVACIRAFADSEKHILKSEKPELLDNVVSYIESHLGEKISLADIAQRFYVSESTISQTFQKKMHVSFYHYVTQRRLIAAKSMMLEENNLDALSEKVGFKDYSTFYRAFKKEFGISPKEYRNLIAESQSNLI